MARTLFAGVVCVMTGVGGLASESAPFESDPFAIDSESYRLCTEAQARIWHEAVYPEFIDWPDVRMTPMLQKSVASLKTAERALLLDEQNPYAHALLARYYLLPLDTDDLALESWSALFDSELGVSLPASFDGAPVISHVRSDGVYIYPYAALGIAGSDIPGAPERTFWDANAGNIPAGVDPSHVLVWEEVDAITATETGWSIEHRQGASSLEFRSGIESFGWDLDWYDIWFSEVDTAAPSFLPLEYHTRLRSTVLSLIDPEGRIRAP